MTEPKESNNKICEIPIETKLVFLGRFKNSILSGTKRISLRLGKRRFSKNIEVEGYWAVVNEQYSCKLREVPFSIFWDEGWRNIDGMIRELSKVYPEITLDSVFTVIEFRLEIPHRKVEKSDIT